VAAERQRPTETERKRRLSDPKALARALAAAGFITNGPAVETDVYFSRPDVDFLETVECLRVRRRDTLAEVTYKPPSTLASHNAVDVIAKAETNVALADATQAGQAELLLEALGMKRLALVAKTRTVYRHPSMPGVTVSIDAVEGIGTFVETEVLRVGDPIEAAELVDDVERRLGIHDLPTVTLPYRDLVRLTD
jgi:adenylate cyclase class 2